MNKFDPDSIASMFSLDESMVRHPCPDDGPLHRFPPFRQPQVVVNGRKGTALAWTRSYGLIEFGRAEPAQWCLGSNITRV
ncbi:hypothetical protein ACTXPA_18470 [Glutamicibacter arilaitensis]|uniref:hypothetical protein n=1 Tax=Glutamicibacter arilaitensis TaxID=256701 RepID=UPI003FD3E3D2